jgi:hypothetical protein
MGLPSKVTDTQLQERYARQQHLHPIAAARLRPSGREVPPRQDGPDVAQVDLRVEAFG